MVVKMDIVLPKQLENLQPWTLELPQQQYSWLSNEDIARIMICFQKHEDWLTDSRVHRPENGRVLMFNRKKVQYRKDMYIWKMRRKRKFPREDHVKLKVNGIPCIAATYVHSDVLPSFHRRCYWLVQNPDIILVHYLNYPYVENDEQFSKDLTLNRNSQQWCDLTKEDLLQQILPMFSNMPWPKLTDLPLTKEMAEVLSNHLVEKHFEDRAQERCTVGFVDKPRAIQPKMNAINRNASFPLCSGTKLLHQQGIKQGAANQPPLSNHLNGNTLIILNQSSLANCTVPVSPAVTTFQHSLPFLNGEGAVACTPPMTIALSRPVSGSQTTTSQQRQPLYVDNCRFSSHDVSHPTRFALNPLSVTNQITVNSAIPDVSSHSVADSCMHATNSEIISPAEEYGLPRKKESTSINELTTINPSLDCDIANTAYGVKDVMVTKCDESLKEGSHTSEFNLDEFDIDSLFKPLPTVELLPDSVPTSAQSAVDDLFPEQLLDTGMREADSLLNLTEHSSDVAASSLQQNGSPQPPQASVLESIADYSPDWSYTEGGVKVLVTGTWTDNGCYMCSFNNVCVPATVVQTGVLRCYCPPHSEGHVDLVVTRDGAIISHPVKFEYKMVSSAFGDLTSRWLTLNENSFKMSILERLERMEERLNSMGRSTHNDSGSYSLHYGLQVLHLDMRNDASLSTSQQSGEFQAKLSELCRHVHSAFDGLPNSSYVVAIKRDGGMTLLHYIAALGYSSLLRELRSISATSSNYFITNECNPRMLDQLDCTPLMWASAVGHVECVELLYDWDNSTIEWHDVCGRSPMGVAMQRGKIQVYNRLLELHETVRAADDDDTSSLDESAISSIGETIDSGEDTMETDDNISVVEANIPPSSQVFREEVENLSDNDQQSELELAESILDKEQDNRCVAMLAEQIMEVLPGRAELEKEDDGAQRSLTLRTLPSFVNSRCGTTSYQANQAFRVLRRGCTASSYHMNWMEFLQLPPRQLEVCYHGALEFDSLRLTEHEQRQLYIAARIVVNASRRENILNHEVIRASLLIQRCYRKYEKFALSKKMNAAAVLIQSKFRSYQEQKRFQRSRHAAILIQSFYRSYKYTRCGQPSSKQTVKLIEDALRGHMTKKRQHQAARKIQRFLRQCHLRSRVVEDSPVPTRTPLRD